MSGACESSASLHVVHAIPMPVTLGAGGFESCTREAAQAIQDSTRARVQEIQQEAGTPVSAHVEPGFVLPVVSAKVARHHANLLVIGRGHLREPLAGLSTDVGSLVR